MFKVVSTHEELIKAYLVRGIVFMEEQDCPYDLEIDKDEHTSLHIIGMDDSGEPYAAARIRFFGDYAKLERIALRKKWRGGGRGKELVEYMIQVSQDRGFNTYKMHAQSHLQKFYGSIGFEPYGEHFDEAGIDHIAMIRKD